MKKFILTIIIVTNMYAQECKIIYIDFIKEKDITTIKTIINNYKYITQTPTKHKTIFKTKLWENKIKNGKWTYYRFKNIDIINKQKIKLKYAIIGDNLKIYAPQKEIIENFKIKVCNKEKIQTN